MKTGKRLGALLCALAMMFAFTACNGNGSTSGATAAEILAAADQKVAEAKSMEANMTMDMDLVMSMQGESYTMKTNTLMNMVMFNDPMKMKINMTMKLDMGDLGAAAGEMEDMNMEMYIVGKDNNYTMYSNDGTGWTSEAVDLSALEQYDPQMSMGLYLKSGESFEKVGEETINDVKTTKFTGVITSEALEEVMKATGVADSMGSMGMDMGELDWEALYSDMGDMPITVWIDEAGYPVRYEMDMKDIMNKMYEKLVDQMGMAEAGIEMSCTKVKITMDCFNYDQATDFEVPAEAMQ